MYADDTQLNALSLCAITKLEKCMAEIEKWIVINKLKLNGEKTDLVITGSISLLKKLRTSPQ